ncbi:LysR family transcriptional regulator [Asaia sp. HN010]|uniref:LysR family transcriptional regulator n=1 Tax=Asaia sp. HN010 TaxID=3081233 RepID=UPI00301850DA
MRTDISGASLLTQFKLRQMEIIKEIYKHKSIAEAADSMGLTAAAVSKACVEFETTMGITLFHRTRKGMLPTEICKSVVDSTVTIQTELKLLSEKIILSQRGEDRPIKIGFQEGPGNAEIFRALRGLPSIRNYKIGFYNQKREDLLIGLKRDEFDIIILARNCLDIDTSFVEINLHKYGCFVASADQCHSFSHIFDNWHIFGKKTWALLPVGYAIRDEFEALLKARKLSRPDEIIEYNSRSALKWIADLYDIFTIIPDYAMKDLMQFRNISKPEEVEVDFIIRISILLKSGFHDKKHIKNIIEIISTNDS